MKKLLIPIFLLSINFAFSETVELNLQSAINLAYENNSELKRQKIVLEAANRTLQNSYNSLIPSISLSAGDNFTFPGEEPANTVNLEGNISLNLKTDIKAAADKNLINYKLEKANYDFQALSVKQSVCDSYFEILEAQQQLLLKTENQKILKELFEENQYKYQKGFLSEIEYLNSKILYEKSKSELLALQLELKNLTNNFKLILGLPVSDDIELKTTLSKLFEEYTKAFTEEYQTALLSSLNSNETPELKILGYQKKVLEKELQIKKLNTFGPDFNLSYQINPVFGQIDSGGRIRNSFSAGISIPLDNLIPSSQNREELNLSKDQIADVDIQISAKKQEMEITLTNLILLVNQKKETLDTCKNLVDVTNSNLNICKSSYSKGILDFQSLKTSNTEYLEAQLEYSNLVLDILKTFSSIEQISGKNIMEE